MAAVATPTHRHTLTQVHAGTHTPHTTPQADTDTRHGRQGCVGTVSRQNGVRVP